MIKAMHGNITYRHVNSVGSLPATKSFAAATN
jgi:hypothetical protein